jgi:hypothetical protein
MMAARGFWHGARAVQVHLGHPAQTTAPVNAAQVVVGSKCTTKAAGWVERNDHDLNGNTGMRPVAVHTPPSIQDIDAAIANACEYPILFPPRSGGRIWPQPLRSTPEGEITICLTLHSAQGIFRIL